MSTNDDASGGYGRPPKAPALSQATLAMPKGRQRGPRNLKTDLASLLKKRVPIREDGELRLRQLVRRRCC